MRLGASVTNPSSGNKGALRRGSGLWLRSASVRRRNGAFAAERNMRRLAFVTALPCVTTGAFLRQATETQRSTSILLLEWIETIRLRLKPV